MPTITQEEFRELWHEEFRVLWQEEERNKTLARLFTLELSNALELEHTIRAHSGEIRTPSWQIKVYPSGWTLKEADTPPGQILLSEWDLNSVEKALALIATALPTGSI